MHFSLFRCSYIKKGITNPEAIDRVGAALASLNFFALSLALRYLTQEFQQTHRW